MRRTSSTVSPAQPESSQQPTALLIATTQLKQPPTASPSPDPPPPLHTPTLRRKLCQAFSSLALSSFLLVMLPVLPFRGCQKTFIQFCTEIHTHTHTYTCMETHTHIHTHAAHKSLSSAAKMPKSFHSIQHTKWHKKRESEQEQLQKNSRKKENTVKKNLWKWKLKQKQKRQCKSDSGEVGSECWVGGGSRMGMEEALGLGLGLGLASRVGSLLLLLLLFLCCLPWWPPTRTATTTTAKRTKISFTPSRPTYLQRERTIFRILMEAIEQFWKLNKGRETMWV